MYLYRKERGISQEQMAEELVCAPSTLSKLETGKVCPNEKTFDKICEVMEIKGIHYEQLAMGGNVRLQRAKEELIKAIRSQNKETIDQKIKVFKRYMDHENEEHNKLLILGDLVYMLKNGMDKKEFIRKIDSIFDVSKELEKISLFDKIQLSKIEHLVVYLKANALLETGYLEQAEETFKILMNYSFKDNSEYYKRRCNVVSTSMAKLLIQKGDYRKAEYCLGFILSEIVDNLDTRILFQCLCLQQELYKFEENYEGIKVIDDYLKASEAMVFFLHKYYEDIRNRSCQV